MLELSSLIFLAIFKSQNLAPNKRIFENFGKHIVETELKMTP